MNSIDLLITTWINHPARLGFLYWTLAALEKNLSVGDRELRLIVSSESRGLFRGSEEPLIAMCEAFGAELFWRPGKPNLGDHLNFAFSKCKSDLRMYVQDDWVLTRPLNIGPGADLLESDETVAMVRYFTARATVFKTTDEWSEIAYRRPAPYGDNPALSHRRWFEKAGPFQVGNTPGFHEVKMGTQLRKSGLRLVAPWKVMNHAREGKRRGDYYFGHIGDISAFMEKRPKKGKP